jgi:hypothetical protein
MAADWTMEPVPGEQLLPAPLPTVERATPADAGCWVEGSRGWRGLSYMVSRAEEWGYPLSTEDREAIEAYHEGDGDLVIAGEIASEAETWLNDHVSPDGYSFGWHDGEFMLWSAETWCEDWPCRDLDHVHTDRA